MKREEEINIAAKNKYPYIKGLPQSSSHQAIFIEGAQWADQTMLERAKEYLENNIDKDLIIYYNNTWKKRDEFIKDFIKAMKGGAE